MNPEISVIIPTYNEEKYIGNTLESIRNQKFTDYEIIVADGNSTDKTREIAKSFADKIVKTNIRTTAAGRNTGAEVAEGKYLVFVDADTILPEDYLEKVFQIFQEGKFAGFSGSFQFLGNNPIHQADACIVNFYFLLLDFFGKTIIPGFNFCIPKTVFRKAGGFENVFIEDANLSAKLCKFGKTKYFSHFFVKTSPRRLKKFRTFGTLEYYCDFKGRWKGAINFSKRYIKVD